MAFKCYSIKLRAKLTNPDCRMLCVQLRALPGVVSAVVDKSDLKIWYRGIFPLVQVKSLINRVTAGYKHTDDTPEMADYRREAILSLGSFIAMQLLKKASPAAFASVKILRSALILYIARNFIKNGVTGLVRDNRPNADTLTATAVIASVLAGKPESSLSLLALSNGAEMLTSYAAEKARGHISGLLNLNQPYVWLVDNGIERKVSVKEIKAGDIIAAHTGEKICIDGQVLSGTAAINQASITGESAPAMKKQGLPVYAGSVVEAGEVIIKVEKVGNDTSLAHVVHLVE